MARKEGRVKTQICLALMLTETKFCQTQRLVPFVLKLQWELLSYMASLDAMKSVLLFSYDLNEHSFLPFSVEFTVEDLLPGSEVELASRYGNDRLSAHYAAFEMGIGVILVSVVPVLRIGLFRRELFEPYFEVLMQARFIVVYEDAGGNVHRIAEQEALFDPALR